MYRPAQGARILSIEGRPLGWTQLGQVMWWAMLPLAAVGSWMLRRRGRWAWPLWSQVVMVMAVTVVVYGHVRFRPPMDLAVIVFAAVALSAALRAAAGRALADPLADRVLGVEDAPGRLLKVGENLRPWHRRAVGPIRRERRVGVHDRQDARAKRDFLAAKPARVTAPVPVLVVAEDQRGNRIGERNVLQDPGADLRVNPHIGPLLLGQRADRRLDRLPGRAGHGRHGDQLGQDGLGVLPPLRGRGPGAGGGPVDRTKVFRAVGHAIVGHLVAHAGVTGTATGAVARKPSSRWPVMARRVVT